MRKSIEEIKLDVIKESDKPIRRKYLHIDELAKSISYVGLINPLLVRPIQDETYRYEIVDGNRRFKAIQTLGYTEIWCMVLPEGITDWDCEFIKEIANTQRDYFGKIERGKWIIKLLEMENPETGKMTTLKDIAEQTGVPEKDIYWWMEAGRTAINLDAVCKMTKQS